MHTYETLKHTTWECKYHVVFVPSTGANRCMCSCGETWGRCFGIWPNRGMQSGGRSSDGRSRAHALERTAEVFGVERDGLHHREERDPYRAGVCWATEE